MENNGHKKIYHPNVLGNVLVIVPILLCFVRDISLILSNNYTRETIVYTCLWAFCLYVLIVSTIVAQKSGIVLEENYLTIRSGKSWGSPSVEEVKKSYGDIESVSILGKYNSFVQINAIYIKFKDEDKKRTISGIKDCKDLANELKNKGINVIWSDMKRTKWEEKDV